MIRPLKKPNLKDLFLQKYLNPFRLTDEDLLELKKEFHPTQVDLLKKAFEDKDYLNDDDKKILSQNGLAIDRLRENRWNYPWVLWAVDCLGSRWFQEGLSPNARIKILLNLGELDEKGFSVPPLVQLLLDSLKDNDVSLLNQILFTLGKIGTPAQEAVPYITVVLHRSFNPEVIFNAVWALGRIKSKTRLPAPELIKLLNEEYSKMVFRGTNVREEAIRALAGMGSVILEELLSVFSQMSRQRGVMEICQKIWSPVIRRELIRYLGDASKSITTRAFSAHILQSMEQKGILEVLSSIILGEGTFLSTLSTLSTSSTSGEQLHAVMALGALGSKSMSALRILSQVVLKEETVLEIREVALETLGKMGDNGRIIINKLSLSLKDPYLQGIAGEILGGERSQKTNLSTLFHPQFREKFSPSIDRNNFVNSANAGFNALRLVGLQTS